MRPSKNLGNAFHRPFACSALALLVVACSSPAPDDDSDMTMTGGSSSSMAGKSNTGGAAGRASGGTGQGGMNASGGAGASGSSVGGAGVSGGGAGRGTGGSTAGIGGSAAGSGGSVAGAGGSVAGAGGSAAGAGGTAAGAGGSAAGAAGSATGGVGGSAGTGGSGSFDPCPATDPCKVLPLGDSITWGISFGGGYRIKLLAKAAADMKKMTYVGYDTGNPAASSAVDALGASKSLWTPNHEGHSGWTIQQDDELVLGTSTATNDGVNYTGKKVVLDLSPNIVLVHLGTNDFRGDIAGAPDRLGKVIDHVVADAPNALVVVASVIPYPGGGAAVATFNATVPTQVKTRADAGKHVIYVDMFAGLTSSDLSDGVHPNEGGYDKMAVVWYAGIKQYLH